MSRTADRQPSMASRLRTKEVAALQRALECERAATRAAQDRCKELQQTLDGERSAGRALRREVAAQVKRAREEEANKSAALLDQLKIRMELAQTETVAAERESLTRSLASGFQRELQARQEEWRRETQRQVELLQGQLRESRRADLESPPRSEVEALVHSLHAEFHRNLHQKQDEWKREHQAQVESLTTQLRELQRLYTDTCNQLTITTNEAENIPKLRQEIHTLKHYNKQLEEKMQMLTEADRRKVEEFRSQHEENSARIAELQKSARKETFQLLEEMKSKDRVIDQLQRKYHVLATRLGTSPSPLGSHTRSRVTSETSLREPERSGEQSRLCIKRPKQLSLASDVNKRLRAQEKRKPPDPPEPDAVTTKKEDDQHITEIPNSWEPVNGKEQGEMESSQIINMWTKKVGLETLYQLLLEEHQELQRSHVAAITRLREEERHRSKLEQQIRECRRAEGDNVINLALAEQITELQQRQAELEAEAQELREQNDLLEFRILELDDGVSCSSFHFKSSSSRSPDTRDREIDDVSDSGVMSLPTSEDISEADFQDFKMEPNNRDVKSKLAQLCQSLENVSERISIQQALALLRHYESRLESLEATLAAMCQEAAQIKSFDHQPSANMEHVKSPSRIIATVLPFNDLSSTYHNRDVKDDLPLKRLLRDQDCMQESGIFEDNGLTTCVLNIGTQTDWTFDPPPGDLGAEIRKLTRIRERIEEKGGNKKLLKTSEEDSEFLTHASLKELLFYRERVQMLEEKIAIYESHGDEQSRLLALRLEKEVLLAAQINHLQSTVRKLKEQNQILEEEKCEFEEAENDTRLRCQKLEVKLSALGEKKSDLQVQLQQNARTMSNLRSSLSEEERKRNEARQYAARMEALVNKLEQQNFEMEEKEMEVRYRLHTLENIVPAMVMYYLWRMLNAVRPFIYNENRKLPTRGSISDTLLAKPKNSDHQNKNLFSFSGLPTSEEKENLRKSLEEIERFLTLKQKGESIEPPNVSGTANAAFLVIEELSNKCKIMEQRIKELEVKEMVYQETVQEGDEILKKMEVEYKQQLKNMEEELSLKQADIEKAEAQIRKLSRNCDLETQFQEQVNQLENEISHLKGIIGQKDKEKKALEDGHERLSSEREEAIDNLNTFIENVEKPLREELDIVKRKMRDLLGDLDLREQEKVEIDEIHRNLVKELNQRGRELDESEVTISELREEVQTLEREVLDLRAALSQERDSNERLLIAVDRERQTRELSGSDTLSLAGSLHEELLDAAEHQVDEPSTADVAASSTPPISFTSRLNDCQKSEQIIKEFDPSSALVPKFLDRVILAYQHSRSCRHCKNTNASDLRHILSTLQKTAPQSRMNQSPPDVLSVTDGNPRRTYSLTQLYPTERHSGPNQPSPPSPVIKYSGEDLSSTVSGLIAKCRVKDHMIRCLADQLRICPWLFNDLLKNLSLDPILTYDFTRISLFEYINGNLKSSITGISEGESDPGYSSINPLLLKVVDRPDALSLLVAWTSPSSNVVVGFQIVVEGQLCERIYSTARTSTVLHPVDLHKPVTITISALQRNGLIVQEHSICYPTTT